MTCHCSSPDMHLARAEQSARASATYDEQQAAKRVAALQQQIASMVADPTKYEILDVVETHNHLVVKVRFPSCTKCAYEGTKVLVYEDVKPLAAMKWKRLDPHFRPEKPKSPQDAPGPIARFRGDGAGWENAMEFAARKRG